MDSDPTRRTGLRTESEGRAGAIGLIGPRPELRHAGSPRAGRCCAARTSSARARRRPRPACPTGVAVALVQLRSDVAARQAQVEVRNGSDEPIEIGEWRSPTRGSRDADARDRRGPPSRRAVPSTSASSCREMACASAAGRSTVEARRSSAAGRTTRPRRRRCPIELDVIAAAPRAGVPSAGAGASRGRHVDRVVHALARRQSGGSRAARSRPTGRPPRASSTIQDTNLLTFAGTPAGRSSRSTWTSPRATPRRRPCICRSCRCGATRMPCRRTSAAPSSRSTSSSMATPGTVELAASEDMRGRILTWVANWCGFGSA